MMVWCGTYARFAVDEDTLDIRPKNNPSRNFEEPPAGEKDLWGGEAEKLIIIIALRSLGQLSGGSLLFVSRPNLRNCSERRNVQH